MNQNAQQAPQIFDMRKRSAKFERSANRLKQRNETSFIWDHIANEFCERLESIKRKFNNILIIGPMAYYIDKLISAGENAIEQNANIIIMNNSAAEDELPYDVAQFDLIISGGTLDSVNDLPGALVQIRRILKADGLLIGTIFGSGSLSMLKSIMMAADNTPIRPHIHPQIDIRTMADLLVRAGLKLPVADRDTLVIRYSNLFTLVNDIRDIGAGNCLSGPIHPMNKTSLKRAVHKWISLQEEDGKVSETVELIHFNGWAPSPDQPKPTKRGSASVSLIDALKSNNNI